MGFPARRVRGADVRPAVRCQVDNGRVGSVGVIDGGGKSFYYSSLVVADEPIVNQVSLSLPLSGG